MAEKKEIGANGLRIISLQAENVKKLVAIDITPNGKSVTVTGANGAGKTSLMDSIFWALGGTAGIQKQPVRKGEAKARIRLDLGELVVERRFTAEGGGSLFVESADGARYKSPQAILDAITGELAFDPLGFTRMNPKDQVNELKRVAQLEVDIDKLDGQNASDFAKRTDVNRDLKARRSAAAAITVATGLPDERLDETGYLDQITAAGEHNTMLERRKAGREAALRDAGDKRGDAQRRSDRAAEMRREAQTLIDSATQFEGVADDLTKEAEALELRVTTADALPDPIDVAGIRVQLEHAQQVNAKLAERDRRLAIEKEAEALDQESDRLTAAMDGRKRQKEEALAAAKMPVPGLSLENGVVTFNGIPFDQASAAEQLTVSFGIAKAANPKLRVITIKDASLLDATSLERIVELAKDGDYQVWLEKVDTSGKIGVYIEDGTVRAIDGDPVVPADKAPAPAGQGSLV